MFWDTWKHCSETNFKKNSIDFSEKNLYHYFSNLYSGKNHPANQLHNVTKKGNENNPLNKPFTKKELLKTINKLKKAKAVATMI